MYSVVLMAALTAGTSTPSWGCGCHGGFGGGGGCHGCHGFFGGWRSGHGCHGCYGGYGGGACSGGACYGGYGGCYGCYGGGYASCSAYAGCNAYGCYGSGCSGGYAAGCYGVGCHGYSGAPAVAPGQMNPSAIPPGAPAPEPVPAPKKEEKGASLNQARLIVEVPADARLYVDDRLMQTSSERRVFHSPRLEEGQTYYYILRAEVVRNGQTFSDTKRVLVHAGEVIQASFRDLDRVAAARTEPRVVQTEANAGQ